MPHPRPQTLEQVKSILRRDLKLGTDAPIADDMPFFGTDIDLDSLDILLLMTSIEKQFKIKIPSEVVGKQVFQTVTTLATYIDENLKNTGGSAASNSAAEAHADTLLQRLPHGEPFRFITRVLNLRPGESGEAVWSLTGSEPFFAGHFPGNPIVPGVLIAEAVAQLSGLVGPDLGSQSGSLAHVDVRFEQPAKPPVEIHLHSKLVRSMGELQQFEVSAAVGQTTIARGTIALHRAAATA